MATNELCAEVERLRAENAALRAGLQAARDIFDDGDAPSDGYLPIGDGGMSGRLARYYVAVRDALDAALADGDPNPRWS